MTSKNDEPVLLTPEQVARRLQFTTRTLARWRKEGDGPRWSRLGRRNIRYAIADLLAWQESRSQAAA